jgi:predicted CoA-binding protein|tara:strand:- start:219 stop:611 length:393 start_codon:yes stop_codon:yes gene_type:complete
LIDSLKDKNNLIALVGASNDKNKYGNKILLDLLSKNYNVVPINQKEDTIAGLKAYTKVQDLPSRPSIINFVVPPEIGLDITKELVEEGYDHFWYQPGAESEDLTNLLTQKNKDFIDDKCIMVVTRLSSNY